MVSRRGGSSERSGKRGLGKRLAIGISRSAFLAVVIILVIIAGIGFGLALTRPAIVTTTVFQSGPTVTARETITARETTTLITTQTATQIVTRTVVQTVTARPEHAEMVLFSGGFYNGKVITFIYTAPHQCVPPLIRFFPGQDAANRVTGGCEVGAADPSAFPPGAQPLWILVPAFAGLSIFGVKDLGSSPEGFPVFTYGNQSYVILTHCGAAFTPSSCAHHMPLLYSPAFDVVERYLNITTGFAGLPQGVLPTPAHSHIVDLDTNASIPWYGVVVLVFDPNIFPDPLTGRCRAIVPSNLSNPTGNCLNDIEALKRAMTTASSSVQLANSNNPIWLALGKPGTQVVIPGVTSPDMIKNANSNIVLFFSSPDLYPYPMPKK